MMIVRYEVISEAYCKEENMMCLCNACFVVGYKKDVPHKVK